MAMEEVAMQENGETTQAPAQDEEMGPPSESGDGATSFPYKLADLEWDDKHFINKQDCYSYDGSPKKLGDSVVMCDQCRQWFHAAHVKILKGHVLPFQRNYSFVCSVCSGGTEQFEVFNNTWSSIIVTAMCNLMLNQDNNSFMEGKKYLRIKEDIIPFIDKNWGTVCHGRNRQQMLENSAVQKCILHTTYSHIFQCSPCKTEAALRNMAKLDFTPLSLQNRSSTTTAATTSKETTKRRSDSSSTQKRKRTAAATAAKKPAAPPAPLQKPLKIPDKCKLVPVPKNYTHEDVASLCQVQISKANTAPGISISEDRMTGSGQKGYRMMRATHGVDHGSWYYEVHINPPGGAVGHVRLGWSSEYGDLEAPVGYDQHSYSWGDKLGHKFHKSIGSAYGDSYAANDVIGCYISMPNPAPARQPRQVVQLKGVEYWIQEEVEPVISEDSEMVFFKNGVAQSVAFNNIWAAKYFPAVALYMDACCTFNFGPDFKFPPENLTFRSLSELGVPTAPTDKDNQDMEDEAASTNGGGTVGSVAGGSVVGDDPTPMEETATSEADVAGGSVGSVAGDSVAAPAADE